jgi:hypothetical protein
MRGGRGSGGGIAADQGLNLIEVAVADDQMTSDFFKFGRLGREHFLAEQMKTQFERSRRNERNDGEEERKSIERAQQPLSCKTPERQDVGHDQRARHSDQARERQSSANGRSNAAQTSLTIAAATRVRTRVSRFRSSPDLAARSEGELRNRRTLATL